MNRKKVKEEYDAGLVMDKLKTILIEENLIYKQKQLIYLQYELYHKLYDQETEKLRKVERENQTLYKKLVEIEKEDVAREDKENPKNIGDDFNVDLNGLEFNYDGDKAYENGGELCNRFFELKDLLEAKEKKIVELENKIIKLQIIRRCENTSSRVEVAEQSPAKEELIDLKAKLEYLRVEGDKNKREFNAKLREYMIKYEESNLKYKQCYEQLAASLVNLEDLRKYHMSKEIKKTQKLSLLNTQIRGFVYAVTDLKNKIFEVDFEYSDLYNYAKFVEGKVKDLEDRLNEYKMFSERHTTKEGDDFYEREIGNLLEACDCLTEENKKLQKEKDRLRQEVENHKRSQLFYEKKLNLNLLKEKSGPEDLKAHLNQIEELNKLVLETCKKLEMSNAERNKLTKLNIERITSIEKFKEDLRNKIIENSSLENKIKETYSLLDDYNKRFEERLREPQPDGVFVICNLCDTNKKDVALVSCMHTFCGECIETRIKLRNRRCPTCGTPFGTNDVRKVYI